QVPGLVSTERLRASEAALAAGDTSGAQELAQQAIDAAPWAASPRGQLALADREAGELAGAEKASRDAVHREPTSWDGPLVLAAIQAEWGEHDLAIRTFHEGRKLAPKLPFYQPFWPGYGPLVYTPEELSSIYARQQQRASQ